MREDFSALPMIPPQVVTEYLHMSCSECHARLSLKHPYLYAEENAYKGDEGRTNAKFTINGVTCPNCNAVFGVYVETSVRMWLREAFTDALDTPKNM